MKRDEAVYFAVYLEILVKDSKQFVWSDEFYNYFCGLFSCFILILFSLKTISVLSIYT